MVDRKFISWSNNAQIWIPQGWGTHYFRETFVLPICPEPVSGRSLRTFFSQPQCRRQLIKHYHHMGFYVHDSWSNNNSCPKKSFISRHHIRSHSQLLVFPKVFIFSFTFLLSVSWYHLFPQTQHCPQWSINSTKMGLAQLF